MVVTASPRFKTFQWKTENQGEYRIERLRVLNILKNVEQACGNMQIQYSETLKRIKARKKEEAYSLEQTHTALIPLWPWGLTVVSRTKWAAGTSCYGLRFQHIKNVLNAGTDDFWNSGFWNSHHSLGNLSYFASFCPAAPRGLVTIRRENLKGVRKKRTWGADRAGRRGRGKLGTSEWGGPDG